MPGSVRIGIVGTSWWIDAMVGPALQSHPQAEMAAICGRNRSRAEEKAAKYSIPQVYTDFREMLAQGRLDAVFVAAPDDLHSEITLAALDAGLHVLCENPLAVTAQQALEMYAKAEAARVKHMVLYTYRWMPFFQYAIGGRIAPVLALAGDAGVLYALVRFAPRARPGDAGFSLTWALLVVSVTLLSPHMQYYDFGILVLPVAIGLETILREGRPVPLPVRFAIAAVFVAYPMLYEAQRVLHFQPLTLVTVALFAWLCRLGRDARLRSAARPATAFP